MWSTDPGQSPGLWFQPLCLARLLSRRGGGVPCCFPSLEPESTEVTARHALLQRPQWHRAAEPLGQLFLQLHKAGKRGAILEEAASPPHVCTHSLEAGKTCSLSLLREEAEGVRTAQEEMRLALFGDKTMICVEMSGLRI